MIRIILLVFSIIFAYICQSGIFAYFLVLLYVGTGLTIANSSSKSRKTCRSGGGPLYSIGGSVMAEVDVKPNLITS